VGLHIANHPAAGKAGGCASVNNRTSAPACLILSVR
jgi:hypothetical protein